MFKYLGALDHWLRSMQRLPIFSAIGGLIPKYDCHALGCLISVDWGRAGFNLIPFPV